MDSSQNCGGTVKNLGLVVDYQYILGHATLDGNISPQLT